MINCNNRKINILNKYQLVIIMYLNEINGCRHKLNFNRL